MMLCSLVLQIAKVRPTDYVVMGRDVHGMVYKTLLAGSPIAADQHDKNAPPPFAVSLPQWIDGRYGYIRVSFLGQEMLNVLWYQASKLWAVNIGQCEVSIEGLSVSPQDHRLARVVRVEELLENTHPVIDLDLASPTAFRIQGKDVFFPAPQLLFGSLARVWRKYLPIEMPEIDLDNIEVIGFHLDLESHPVLPGINMRGAKGSISFYAKGDEDQRRWLNALAGLSYFCGVGKKTGFGMGQVLPKIPVLSPKVPDLRKQERSIARFGKGSVTGVVANK